MNRKVPLKIRELMKELKEGLVRIYEDKLKGVYLYGSYALAIKGFCDRRPELYLYD